MAALAAALFAKIEPPKPGWNLFSRQQDVQLGKEAQAQVEQQMQVVHNSQVSAYLRDIGARLTRSQYAGDYPYTFGLVADKNINAFSLPGGPVYVNTGLISAAENEAQLAGVLAHEISHVALRHATNQASKANLIRLPAILAGAVAGGGMLGNLAQLGIGLGANSVLLKFSRGAESQADYNGALIMADAGYNPIEMARFFEKLEAQGGSQGKLAEFLSDHPNPGNRVKAVEQEIQEMPRRDYNANTGQFDKIKSMVGGLPQRGALRGAASQVPDIRPSSNLTAYRNSGYTLEHPSNWQVFGDQEGRSVTIAPRDALFQRQGGGVDIGYGALISYYFPPGDEIDLKRDTNSLVAELQKQGGNLQVREQRSTSVGGQQALYTLLNGRSPYQGESEVDALITVPRPQGLFYAVFISPSSEWKDVESIARQMIASIRFN